MYLYDCILVIKLGRKTRLFRSPAYSTFWNIIISVNKRVRHRTPIWRTD